MIKPVSVSYKLGLAIMVIVLSVLLPLGFIINRAVTNFYISNTQSELQDLGGKLASTLSMNDLGEVKKSSKDLLSLTNDQAIIFDKEGNVIVNKGNLAFTISKVDWDSLIKHHSLQEQWQSPKGKTYLLVGVPIIRSNQTQGAVLLFASMDTVLSSVHGISSTLYLAGFGAVLLALGFTNFLSKRLSKPLKDMEIATKQISEGNLNVRLKLKSEDELGHLSKSINDMALSLEQIQRQRKEFFANIAHELKTPITYLSGYADVLKKGLYHTKEEEQRYLSIIQEESNRLTKLINDLFDLAILDEGKLALSLECIELNEIVSSTCQSVTGIAKEKGILLNTSLSDSPLWVEADPIRMTQIYTNLLTNAIRYTDKGEISVTTYLKNQRVFIEIEDTGVGIKEEEQKQIFDRFFRSDKSRSRRTGGTGLGLAIVKELVEVQNGTINVHSEIGKGTRFTLIFPQAKGRIET
jgi:signal transduction histidine kinase